MKHLLIEAKQKVPPFLQEYESEFERYVRLGGEVRACSYCDGPGHRITECPKLATEQRKQQATIGHRDLLGGRGAAGSGDY